MTPWRTAGLLAGLAGAVVTGAAVSAVTLGRRERRRNDLSGLPLGELDPDRECTVVAEDGVPLAVAEVDPDDGGAPDLTVVLVHGFVVDRRMWHFQRIAMSALTAPRVRQVLYDQRGHGRSGRSTWRASTIEQLGRDLDSVLRAVVPSGPVVLVGHSMGGMTIMALAEQQPEFFMRRVVGVALLCSSAGELSRMRLARPLLGRRSPLATVGGFAAAGQPGLVEWARRLGADATLPLIRTLAFGEQPPTPAQLDLMERMIAGTSVEVMTQYLRTLGEHDRFRALVGLRQCEVLVLGGDTDRVTPYSHTEALAAALPDAELVRATGAGHMAPLERPDVVNEHLVGLLRRGAAATAGARRRRQA
jgi:pimeloyl-ACP methyl ester carboxylesterase